MAVERQGQVPQQSPRDGDVGAAAEARAHPLPATAFARAPRRRSKRLADTLDAHVGVHVDRSAEVGADGRPVLQDPERADVRDGGERERLLLPGLQQRRQVSRLRPLRGVQLSDCRLRGASMSTKLKLNRARLERSVNACESEIKKVLDRVTNYIIIAICISVYRVMCSYCCLDFRSNPARLAYDFSATRLLCTH